MFCFRRRCIVLYPQPVAKRGVFTAITLYQGAKFYRRVEHNYCVSRTTILNKHVFKMTKKCIDGVRKHSTL